MTIQAVDVERYRAEFPFTKEWAYLNHAAYGPFPTRTAEAVTRATKYWTNPSEYDRNEHDHEFIEAREWLAKLAGGRPDRVAFTSSLAEGMNLLAHGIDWRADDNALLETGEFPSVVYPFLNLAERQGIEIRWIERDEGGHARVEDFTSAIDDRTRAVAVSHIEWRDGFKNDLHALGALCRSRNVELFVDVTQSLGAQPIELDATGVTAVAAHGYKWLLSNFESGVMILAEDALERIRPIFAGRESVDVDAEDTNFRLNWKPTAERFQLSSLNTIRMSAMHASLTLLVEVGVEASSRQTTTLTNYLNDELTRSGYEVISDRSPTHRSQILTFSCGSPEDNSRMVDDLHTQNIAVSLRSGNIRVSPYFYNTTDDIDRLIEALPPR